MVNLQMMETALWDAARHLMRAAGADERLTPREFRKKINALSGEMRDLTEALYRFVVEIDREGANHITEKDIEKAIARIKTEIFPQYAIAENVMDEQAQKTVQAIAPKTALNLALQVYQTAWFSMVLPAAQVFQQIQAYTEGLFFDYLGSEASIQIEAVHVPSNLTMLTQDTFAQALGLDQDKPEQMIERYREAASFFPIFIHQHMDIGLEEQARQVVEVMQKNLRQHIIAVIGQDSYEVDSQHPVYVVGLAGDGSLVGFKSLVIWT